jgi:hypothetical protein
MTISVVDHEVSAILDREAVGGRSFSMRIAGPVGMILVLYYNKVAIILHNGEEFAVIGLKEPVLVQGLTISECVAWIFCMGH